MNDSELSNMPDEIIVAIFKSLDIKLALELAKTSRRFCRIFTTHKQLLWEHYFHRDFPKVACSMDKDFRTAYLAVYQGPKKAYLKKSLNSLLKVINYITTPANGYMNIAYLPQIRDRILATNDESTLDTLTTLHKITTSAISAASIVDGIGNTPLNWAAYYGMKEIADGLIVSGANLNVTNSQGQTPLIGSIISMRVKDGTEIALKLIRSNANVDVADTSDRTPLILAAINRNYEVVEALISAGANIHATDKDGKNALTHAQATINGSYRPALIDLIQKAMNDNTSSRSRRMQTF